MMLSSLSKISEKTKLIVLSSNNPTGCVYTKESLDAEVELGPNTYFYVLCDDVCGELLPMLRTFHILLSFPTPDLSDRCTD